MKINIPAFLDKDDTNFLFLASMTQRESEKAKWNHDRLDFERDLARLRWTGRFRERPHMIDAVDRKESANHDADGSGGLGGEHPKSISDILGISKPSTRRHIDRFIHAVNTCPKLDVKIPTTEQELELVANQWDDVSGAFGVYKGCVEAIDGWLCCIDKPSEPNAVNYFSGHYQRHGINIQAMCDSNLCFICFSVNSPGKTNDLKAFNCCLELRKWLDNLPENYFIVGEDACPLSLKLLIPFSGADKHSTHNRTYNHCLSQLRIRIEMAFGLLSTKFRVFRRNLDVKLECTSQICFADARLHNFMIDNDKMRYGAVEDVEDVGVEVIQNRPKCDEGYLASLPLRSTTQSNGNNSKRLEIINELVTREMKRPLHDSLRNQELVDVTVYEEE